MKLRGAQHSKGQINFYVPGFDVESVKSLVFVISSLLLHNPRAILGRQRDLKEHVNEVYAPMLCMNCITTHVVTECLLCKFGCHSNDLKLGHRGYVWPVFVHSLFCPVTFLYTVKVCASQKLRK